MFQVVQLPPTQQRHLCSTREISSNPYPPLGWFDTQKASLEQLITKTNAFRLEPYRVLLRGLRMGSITVSTMTLLRSNRARGISARVAWLASLQVERRLPPLSPGPEE